MEDVVAGSPTSPAAQPDGVRPVTHWDLDIDGVRPTVAPGLEPPSSPSPTDAIGVPVAELMTPAVEYMAPPVPHGASTDTDAATSILIRWESLTAIASPLRVAPAASTESWDIVPGVTHELNGDFGAVHPRGRSTDLDMWSLQLNVVRQQNMQRIGYNPLQVLTMVKGMPMGCLLVSYTGAPADETIPYHATVLEPLQPHSLICWGPDRVGTKDAASGMFLADGEQLFCSWRDPGEGREVRIAPPMVHPACVALSWRACGPPAAVDE